MATYKTYSFKMPSSTYTPEEYSDNKGAYAGSISQAQANLNRTEANKPGAYSSAYTDRLNELINKMGSRQFNYDVNGDALYQMYKNAYMQQGKQAMADTIGQASAMTGGYGNSYAASAGNQAYQASLEHLNDRIPELYQLALARYQNEGTDIQNMYNVLANQDSIDYGRYRDTVSDYQSDRAYYDTALQNLRSMNQNLWSQNEQNRYNSNEQAWNNYKWGETQTQNNYQQAVAEDQWNAQFAENQRQFNENMAYNREKAAQNAAYQAASLLAKNKNDESDMELTQEQMAAYAQKPRVKNFISALLTKDEFERRGKSTKIGDDTKVFDNYKQYVSALMEYWWKSNRITDEEASYLRNQYGV